MSNYFADWLEGSADRSSFTGIEDVTEFIFHVDDVFCIISGLIKLNTCCSMFFNQWAHLLLENTWKFFVSNYSTYVNTVAQFTICQLFYF